MRKRQKPGPKAKPKEKKPLAKRPANAPVITTNRIQSLQEMAVVLGRMVFTEVERLRDISGKVALLEDELLNEALLNPEAGFLEKLKMYEAVTRRGQNGRQFVLQFVEMLDTRGGFNPEEVKEEESDVYEIEGLPQNEKEELRITLRKVVQTKING